MTEPTSRPMSRAGLAEAALELVEEEGLDALTMRTLAERMGVKAASLYWHVRDRDELLELVADALLAHVPAPPPSSDPRQQSLSLCLAAGATVAAQRDGDRILLGVPGALRRSAVYVRLVEALSGFGAGEGVTREAAAMMLGFMVAQPPSRFEGRHPSSPRTITLAIDSGSRGVVVHAGASMETLFRIPSDTASAAPAVLRDERLVVRRLRGSQRGEIEINPAHPWRVQVQGPTWNTLLDLRGVNLREVHLDSSATKVECLLPRPRGVVPIHVSGGVLRVTLKRIPGTPVVADISSGAVQIRLDDFHPRLALGDSHWETAAASQSPDRYELKISGGAVRVTLDQSATEMPTPVVERSPQVGDDVLPAVLGSVLDGLARSRTA